MVLLKNEGILPLSKDKKIGLVGNLAENKGQMLGAWAINGRDEDCVSILEGMKANFENLKYEACIKDNKVDLDMVKNIADQSEVIVAVVGETKEMAGEETVQLSIQDVVAKRVRPVRELKGFKKVILDNGESKKVEFIIPTKELGYYDNNMNYIVEEGKFKIYVGGSLKECLETEVDL